MLYGKLLSFVNPIRKARSQRTTHHKPNQLRLEILEDRRLLTVSSMVQWAPFPVSTLQVGQLDTLTVKVSAAQSVGTPPRVAPTGSITFTDNSTVLGSITLVPDASGTFSLATFSTSTLKIGSHEINARYVGDIIYSPSYASAKEYVAVPTTTTLASSANPSVVGQYVTFTATVAPIAPATAYVGGTVTFSVDGGTAIPVNFSGGVAKWSTSSLTLGSHSVAASFLGTSTLAASSSTILSQTVNQAGTVTTLSVPSTGGVGRSITLTATVAPHSPGYGHPTGLVTIYDNSTALGSVSLGTSATASLTLPKGLIAGVHSLTAVYAGDANFVGSTSLVVNDNIEALATYTALAASTNPVVVGQAVTYTATVNSSSTNSGSTATPATGLVKFYDGDNLVATVPFNPAVGNTVTAKYTTTYTASGSPRIKAVYAGDTGHSSSFSSVLTEIVSSTKSASHVYLSSSANPSISGKPLTLTITVNAGATGTLTLSEGATTLASGSPNATGKFTFTTSTLAVGTHLLTASYSGDGNFTASTSPVFTQNVKAAGTITLVSSLNPALLGQAVTFSGTVAGTPTPTGTVMLYDGTTILTPTALALDATGSYSLTVSTLAGGAHQITARYSGSSAYSEAYASLSEVVVASTTTTLASSANPSVVGQYVTFTATVAPVAPATASVGGTVSFAVDGGTAVFVNLSGGVAKWSTSGLTLGSHSVVASFLGTSTLAASSSTISSQTVNQANTVTTLSAPSTGGAGRSLTLTATVAPHSPGYGHPTGLVTFYDDTTSLGSVSLGSTSTVSLTLPSGLSTGAHPLTAVYSGDANFVGSASLVVNDNIEALATYTALTASANPVVVGQTVTYTATVSSSTNPDGNATPATGSVEFYDGDNLVATVPFNPAVGNTVTAQYATTYTAAGSHLMKAVYAGDTGHSSSFSSVLTEVVGTEKATSHVYLSSSANPSIAGNPLTFTITVNTGATGTVILSEGTTTLASGSPDATGKFTFTTSSLAQGTHLLTASYSGDSNFTASTSAVFTQNVKAAATIALVSSSNPSLLGHEVTFSGTVAGTPTPTGTVSLYDGSTNLTPTALALDANGAYSFTISTLTVGSHQITARYSGDSVYSETYASLSEVVMASTTTTLTSSANPSIVGQPLTFTATIAPVAPATGTVSGTVNFSVDGGTAVAVTLEGGVAKWSTSSLTLGSHSVVASFLGTSAFTASSDSISSQTVNQANTVTTLSAPLTGKAGNSLTLTATVAAQSPGNGHPTGLVTFYNNTTSLGSVALGTSSTVTLTLPNGLSAGTHPLTAVYAGDANFIGSTSLIVSENILAAPSVTLVSSLNPAASGHEVTFSGTVVGTPTPTGTVNLYDGSTNLTPTALTLDANGAYSFTISTLAVGSHQITARYSRNSAYSEAYASLSETITAATTTTLTSSANPSVVGKSVTFTATVAPVAPATGTVSGTVNFSVDGGTAVAVTFSGGVAKWSTSSLTLGSHSVEASFVGTSAFAASSNSISSQTVNQANTVTTLSAPTSANAGSSLTLTATVAAQSPGNGHATGHVTFYDNTTSLGFVALGTSSTVTLTLPNGLSAGEHPLTAVYSGDTNFIGSTSAIVSEKILAAPLVTLVSSLKPALFGQAVTFSGKVAATTLDGPTPTGTVSLYDGSTILTPTALTLDANDAYSFTISTLAVGTHQITARYSGNSVYAIGYAPLSEVVQSAPASLSADAVKMVLADWANPVS